MEASLVKNPEGWRIKISMQDRVDIELMYKIKSLPNWKYSKVDKSWLLPVRKDIIEKLQQWNIQIPGEAVRMTEEKKIEKEFIEKLPKGLYPFQQEGVSFIERRGGRALIGDEMGLGKTIQALAWLRIRPDARPVLIVTPASLKLNWKREIEKWVPGEEVEMLYGQSTSEITGTIAIINYDILHLWVDEIRAFSPKVIITDECHFYKSNKARRTKAIKMISKGVPYFIALSGTPIINKPIEIYNALRLIEPSLFPNEWYFIQRYCNPKFNGFGWDYSGASNTKELHKILTNTVMIRRLKSEVYNQLPKKIRSYIPMELNNRDLYKQAERGFVTYVQTITKKDSDQTKTSTKIIKARGLIEALKQLAVEGKMNSMIQWIKDFLEIEDKLVVFTMHRKTVDILMEEFKDIAVRFDGSTTQAQREKAVYRFQNDPKIKLFVGNIQAAGVGITLTAASNVAILELPWTPGELVQAEDRCHRIGQTKTVNIHYLLAEGTIEERIAKIIDTKRKVLDEVLDGKSTDKESLLMELIKSYMSNE